MHDFCKDKDLEAGALKLEFQPTKICVIQVYRSPSGNLQFFSQWTRIYYQQTLST